MLDDRALGQPLKKEILLLMVIVYQVLADRSKARSESVCFAIVSQGVSIEVVVFGTEEGLSVACNPTQL